MATSLGRSAAISLVAIAAAGITRLIFAIAIGRFFGAEVLGEANSIISIGMLISLVVSPGVGQALAKKVSFDRGRIENSSLDYSTVLVTLSHHLLLTAAALVVGLWTYKNNTEAGLLIAVAIGYGIYTFNKALLYSVEQVATYARNEIGSDILFLVALGFVIVQDFRTLALLPVATLYGVFSLATTVKLAKLVDTSASHDTAANSTWQGPLIKYAVLVTVGTLASTGFFQLTMVLASQRLNDTETGYYAAAMAAVTPAFLIPRALSSVLFPAMAKNTGSGNHQSLHAQLDQATTVLASLTVPAFALAACVSPLIMTYGFGKEFQPAAVAFAILAGGIWVYIASVPAVNYLSTDTRLVLNMIPPVFSVLGAIAGLSVIYFFGDSLAMLAAGYAIGPLLQGGGPAIATALRRGKIRWKLTIKTTLSVIIAVSAVYLSFSTSMWFGFLAALSFIPIYGEYTAFARKLSRSS